MFFCRPPCYYNEQERKYPPWKKTLSQHPENFINIEYLEGLLTAPQPDAARVREIVAKSLNKEALSVEETAALLRADSPELIEEIFNAARTLKRQVYGNRIVLFAPLYIGSLLHQRLPVLRLQNQQQAGGAAHALAR